MALTRPSASSIDPVVAVTTVSTVGDTLDSAGAPVGAVLATTLTVIGMTTVAPAFDSMLRSALWVPSVVELNATLNPHGVITSTGTLLQSSVSVNIPASGPVMLMLPTSRKPSPMFEIAIGCTTPGAASLRLPKSSAATEACITGCGNATIGELGVETSVSGEPLRSVNETITLRAPPTMRASGVKAWAFAPTMSTPSSCHWYAKPVPSGSAKPSASAMLVMSATTSTVAIGWVGVTTGAPVAG